MAAIVGHRASHSGLRKPLYTSAALALGIETLLLAGVGAWLLHPHVVPMQRPAPMVITLAPAAPVPKPLPRPAPKPMPVAAPAMPKPTPQAAAQQRHVAPVHPARVAHTAPPKPRAQPVTPPPPTPAPEAAPPAPAPTSAQTAVPTEPAPVAPPAAATMPAAGRPDASFAAALRAAIQLALHYPESARMEGTTGRTLVAFMYRDSAVSHIRVVTSSGMGLLDHAAVAAVRDAQCPPPPRGMEGKNLPEQLWIDFRLDGNG
jgi:protein TonB